MRELDDHQPVSGQERQGGRADADGRDEPRVGCPPAVRAQQGQRAVADGPEERKQDNERQRGRVLHGHRMGLPRSFPRA
jgi:hypothetical protein